jgi:hypothetical protein
MAGIRPSAPSRLPSPGADSRAIIASLGFDDTEIDALFKLGVAQ